jgi:hypothetical protein
MTNNLGVNWVRIFLCGLVVGVVWFLLSAIALALAGGEFLKAVQGGRLHTPRDGLYFFAIDLAMGFWAMWLYAAIRPRCGSGPKASVVAGFAWWLIKSLESAKWVGLGFVPLSVTPALLAATLPAPILAVLVGAWLYSNPPHPTAHLP